jgi:hypothetical protein
MAISINHSTYVISVPQSDLSLISGTLYELDTDDFRKALKEWEASEDGIVEDDTHVHFTTYTIAGVTYARAINILSPYSITFENGAYSVQLSGSNNNIWDIGGGILNQNTVQVIPTNSAGLQIVSVGSGVLPSDITDIADAVWDELLSGHTDTGSAGEALGNISAGASPSTIADAVWDEDISTHTTTGSAGAVFGGMWKKIKAIFNEVV